jgi:hypothetical protein
MMVNTISKELHNALSEFHKLSDLLLTAVRYVCIDGCLDKIVLEFDQVCLLIEAEADFDTVIFQVINNEEFTDFSSTNASHLEPWNAFIGRPFGWGWITINQQNYVDGIQLSFELIHPNVSLNVIASSISVSTMNQISVDCSSIEGG